MLYNHPMHNEEAKEPYCQKMMGMCNADKGIQKTFKQQQTHQRGYALRNEKGNGCISMKMKEKGNQDKLLSWFS